MRLNIDDPIHRYIVAEGQYPSPELLFAINPILNPTFIYDESELDKPFKTMILVYQYDEQIGKDKYRYIFKGYRMN